MENVHLGNEALRGHAETLLDPEQTAGQHWQAAQALFDALAAIIDLDDNAPGDDDLRDTWVDGGRAISPREAARCLREYQRSQAFMQGVQAAIAEARRRFPGETIEVLYAGCGPFATLAVPLAHRWAAEAVRYTLLDLHPRSLHAAEQIARHLGVADRIREFVCADAVHYRCADGLAPHVLVTETMTAALAREPQVAICRNLVPQLRAGGLLVPERIDLLATVMPPLGNAGEARDVSTYRELGRVMRLDIDNAARGGDCGIIDWDESVPTGWGAFVRTHIDVFADIVLRDGQCSLNLPMALPVAAPRAEDGWLGERLRFEYVYEPEPGLRSAWQGAWRAPAATTRQRAPMRCGDDSGGVDGVGALRIPMDFDPGPLQAELRALSDADWRPHPNTQDYAGAWRSLSLRSLSGREGDAGTHSDRAGDYHDTPALARSPALRALLEALPAKVGCARLLSLSAGARIHEHRDPGTDLWSGTVRLHVPIKTDARVRFTVDGRPLSLAAGECWYLNADHPHAVHNGSDQERVHLVIDCEVDDALVQQFLAWGHPPRRRDRFSDPSLSLDNVDAIIAMLREGAHHAVADGLAAEAERLRAAQG